MADVIDEIRAERNRQQTEEGFDASHDDTHDSGALARAAMAYCQSASLGIADTRHRASRPPSYWPWGSKWWKPTTARRDLIKAAALIVAEVERIDRENGNG